jgi:HEAT repeat protein
VQRLGESRNTEDLAALLVAQQDPQPDVRRAAARAYAMRGGSSAQEGLAAMLGDPDPEVVAAAARALGVIRPEGAGTDAREAAELQRRAGVALAEAYGRADAKGRSDIANALQSLGGSLRDAVDAEAHWLWERNTRELGSRSAPGRAGAAEELGRSGRTEAARILLPLIDLDGDPVLQAASVRGLGWAGDASAVEPLAGALRSRWAEVAEGAAWALGNIGAPTGADALAEVGVSAPARVALATVAGLEALPPAPEVGVALCELAVRSADPTVAARAAAGARTRDADCPEKVLVQRIARGGTEAVSALAAFGSLGLRGERLKAPGERAVTLFQTTTDPRIRAAAARALGTAPYPAALPALQKRAGALLDRAVGPRGEPAAAGTARRAATPPFDVEELADVAVALARLAPDAAGPLALGLAGDPDPRLRAASARALGLARTPVTAGPLLTLAKDDDAAVRRAAIEELGALGAPGVPALAAALAARPPDDEESAAFARAFGATGDAGAIPHLGAMLGGPGAPAAASAIGRLGLPGGVAPLLASLAAYRSAGRVEVIEALEVLGAPEAGEPLSRELTSDRPEVRAAAARALGRLRHEAAAPRLEALRADYYAAVRRAAVEALARLPTRAPARR